MCASSSFFWNCGKIRGEFFLRGGYGSVREDTSISGDAAVSLFGRVVDNDEVDNPPTWVERKASAQFHIQRLVIVDINGRVSDRIR